MKKHLTLLAAGLFTTTSIFGQWNNIAPDSSDFTKIKFTSGLTAYILKGDASSMVMGMDKTIDGGTTWTNVPFNSTLNVRDFSFVDDNTGFACADKIGSSPDSIQLFKTINGGTTWTLVHTFAGAVPINAKVYFTDNLHGIVTETYGKIWKTSDGGVTWTNQDFGYYYFNDIEFNGSTGYIGCADGTFNYYGVVLKTTDGGANWTEVFNFSSIGEHYSTVNSLSFIHDTLGFMATQNYLYKTTDGGVTWDSLPYALNHGMVFQDIYFVDILYGFGCDGQGGIYMTVNGGTSWTIDRARDSVTWLNSIDLSNGNAYVAGSGGKILRRNILGIQEKHQEPLMNIYPNPSTGRFYLQKKDARPLDVQVYETTGKLVYSEKNFTGNTLDLSNLPGGTYLLRYGLNGEVRSQLLSISK